jgi:ATP-dependent phosphofructokinase / diphosphate-dependent phosphofructokinase
MKEGSRIGILTGGGDVPGLNSAVRAFTLRAVDDGHQVLGIRRGWGGLVEIDPAEPNPPSVLLLDRDKVRTVDRHGGTFLHTSRTNPAKLKRSEMPAHLAASQDSGEKPVDATPHVLRVLEALRIDALVAIGGDDTLSYAVRLDHEGFPVVAIPKTMDNDVPGTDYCIGFSTAVTRSVNFLIDLRTPAGSHERIAVVELFGRYCGETSLISAYLASADRAIISEVPFDPERLAKLIMDDKRANPSNYAMLTISEGARMTAGKMVQYGDADAYGHRKLGGIGLETGDILKKLTGQDIVFQQLSYLMRSGAPDSLDLMVAVNYANMAIDLIMKRVYGRMIALRQGIYTDVPLSIITTGQKRVDVRELYDEEQYRPKVRHVMGKPMFLY